MELDQETVYGTHEDSYVMSEKVQTLANSIYQEFSRMIQKYDEDVVKDLVPLVVNVLECLDISYTETQEHEVELELLREDNEQLVTQYEREKQLRKASEQKCLEIEDAVEGENKELQEKIESLESIVRMFELKSKNAADHVLRLEEKESENKKEYAKLHERYTELFKTHMDYMERTKILFGNDLLDQLATSKPSLSGSQVRSGFGLSYNMNSMDAPVKSFESAVDFSSMTSPNRSSESNTSLKSELQEVTTRAADGEAAIRNTEVQSHETSDKGQLTDEIPLRDRSTITRGGWVDNLSPDLKDIVNSTPELEDIEDITHDLSIGPDHRQANTSRGRPNNLYQELTFQDTDALGDVDEGADITGMGKEVENLILENNELLATKNALNIVKDDLIAQVDNLASEQEILHQNICSLEAVKEKLKNRVAELEEELKKMKEEAQKNAKVDKSDDEEDVPMAQRKRFTRVEMARVLMERNQYKERFMELQEAVRWTEMIRASRTDPTLDSKKNRSTVWKFFSSLFASSEKPQRKPLPYLNVKYNAPTHHVAPALDTMRKNLNERRKGLDFLDSEIASEKLQAQKAKDRREQYKQVRAHVKKDDGRMQAYGWSLPTKSSGSAKSAASDDNAASRSSASHVPVPVPVYCRPLMEKQTDTKKEEENGDDLTMQETKDLDPSEICCAAGVNLSGGRTRDGGSIVGTSVFYSNPSEEAVPAKEAEDSEVEKLNKELEEQVRELEDSEKNLSSLVWICTSNRNSSRVSVIDANNPADVLGSFHVCTSHVLCIASVPGAKESDYPVDEGVAPASEKENKSEDSLLGPGKVKEDETSFTVGSGDGNRIGMITHVTNATVGVSESPVPPSESVSSDGVDHNIEDARDKAVTSETRLMKEPSDIVKDGMTEVNPSNEIVCEEMEKMSSVLPTMWLGSHKGHLYVHSAVSQWRRCLHSVRLDDAVLSIVHVKGRVLVALADGTIAIFRRGLDGQWDLANYHLLDLGKPYHSIRCMVKVHDSVWCGYRNRIHVVDPKTMEITKSFDAHPRKESQVRQMAWIGDGVWVSIRLDSTLRLYHASSYQHLQDVDIEPYVSKMLGTGKLGFSFVRVTALLISSNRLWMGTSNGVIISVPLSESMKQLPNLGASTAGNVTGSGGKAPGGVVRVYANAQNEKITPGSFIPYCSMAQAQLSFHGHRDAVKFFVSVPGSGGISAATSTPAIAQNEKQVVVTEQNEICVVKKLQCMLVVSGGEGYIDFRIGDGEEDENETGNSTLDLKPISLTPKGEPGHLIVWQVTMA